MNMTTELRAPIREARDDRDRERSVKREPKQG